MLTHSLSEPEPRPKRSLGYVIRRIAGRAGMQQELGGVGEHAVIDVRVLDERPCVVPLGIENKTNTKNRRDAQYRRERGHPLLHVV
jgi:hypothetical protein